jgi:hypothetical protein
VKTLGLLQPTNGYKMAETNQEIEYLQCILKNLFTAKEKDI